MAGVPLDINQATAEELMEVRDIGSAYSSAIYAKRKAQGSVTLDDFHDDPRLQTVLHRLVQDGILTFGDYEEDNGDDPPTAHATLALVLAQMKSMDTSLRGQVSGLVMQLQDQQKQQAELVKRSVDSLEKKMDAKLAKLTLSGAATVKVETPDLQALTDPNVVWKSPLQAISEGISKYTPPHLRDMKPPLRSQDTATTWSQSTPQSSVQVSASIPVSVSTDKAQLPSASTTGISMPTSHHLSPQMPVPSLIPPFPYPPPGFPGYRPVQGFRSGSGHAKIPP